MTLQWWIGFLAAFFASAVEVVEAVTVVLASGVTRGWRSTWIGVVAAALTLTVLVVAFGPALLTYIPLDALRVVVGTLLLIFGLQWMRKAVLRYTGYKGLHDEAAIYQRQVAALQATPASARAAMAARRGMDQREVSALQATSETNPGMDWTAFTVSYKAVLLEGLEVVFIVITFGLTTRDNTPAVLGAALAAILITLLAVVVRGPLSRIPENTLKFGVSIMLCAFGTFWAAEGVGLTWPGSDAAILALLAFYLLLGGGLVALLRPRAAATPGKEARA